MNIDPTAFALDVAKRIGAQFHVTWVVTVDSPPLASVRFSAMNTHAVKVVLSTYFDGTFQIEAGSSFVIEQDSMPKSLDEQTSRATELIEQIARSGIVTVRSRSWLGPLSPSTVNTPTSPDIVAALASPRSKVVESQTGWERRAPAL